MESRERSKNAAESAGTSAALQQAKEIVTAARKEAQQIIDEAHSHAATIRKQSQDGGFEEGLNRAFSQVLDLADHRQKLVYETKEKLLQVALAVSEEVIGESIKTQPESIMPRLERALMQTFGGQVITISVNPADRTVVLENIARLEKNLGRPVTIAVAEDVGVLPGDARIETESGVIRSTLSSHLAAIKEKLLTR